MVDHSYPRLIEEAASSTREQPLRADAERIPAMLADPFDSSFLLDLADAAPLNFNLVDGTDLVADKDMAFVLYKGHNPNTWFYAPRWARIALNRANGEPAFTITKKVRNNPDGSKTTLGGVLSFMVELSVELPSDDELQRWTDSIKKFTGAEPAGRFNFQPLRLSPGKMDVSGLGDQYARPGQALKNVDVGAGSSIGFAVELTPEGADHFAALVGASPAPFPPQVAILFTFKYQYLIPQCSIRASGFKKRAYDYFSANARARASYFGLVNGSGDYQAIRADLRSMEALDVQVVGTPPAGVELQKLLDAVFDMYVKQEVGKWIEPDPTPVETPEPGGFFGGLNVKMKSVSLSDTAQFSQTLDFVGISENLHQISFNFEQQLGDFDPVRHLFIEQDDLKLPFKLAIGSSEKVKIVAPSASYTTAMGPQNIHCPVVTGKDGGLAEGIIQFTWPQRPTSAQVSLLVNFVPPFGAGYEFRSTQPVSDTGAAFLFEPDQFVQRTRLFMLMAGAGVDRSSKALFKWEWTPPQANGTARPKLSGYTMIAPDPNGDANNLPTYDIEFPYHPDDWTGESTPKIQYKIQGLTGDWKNQTASGEISIGETSLALDWNSVSSIGDMLSIPALLNRFGIPDPVHRERLVRQYARPLSQSGNGGVMLGGAGTGGRRNRPALGYKPDPANEPALHEREMIAKAHRGAARARSRTYPPAYDLRDVAGRNFITSIKEQGCCGSCVGFGVCATVEGTLQVLRDDPHMNPDFSEGHLFYCLGRRRGRTCGNVVGNPPAQEPNGGWWPGGALDEFQRTGVTDEACFPYVSPATPFDPTPPCKSCRNWSGRVTKISSWTVLSVPDQMKAWIAGGKGPLVGAFTVYQDFLDYFQTNNDPHAIYRRSRGASELVGGHCICVVGYSDEDECWICKNSWGPYWAASGFFKIGYGEVGIDAYMWGVTVGDD